MIQMLPMVIKHSLLHNCPQLLIAITSQPQLARPTTYMQAVIVRAVLHISQKLLLQIFDKN